MFAKLGKLAERPGYYLMRSIGRFAGARQIVPMLMPPSNQRPVLATDSLFPEVDVSQTVDGLRKDGIALGLQLSPGTVKEIMKFALATPCYGNACPDQGFYYHDREKAEARAQTSFVKARYFNTHACPEIARLQADPKLWEIAERYLGAVPLHTGNNLWWNFPGQRTVAEQNKFAQLFHFDLDDYRFVKFFFYLTDVDGEAGPHTFVRGSHRKKPIGFAEDTYGVHKGVTPTAKARLILQFEFALYDYGLANDLHQQESLRMAA